MVNKWQSRIATAWKVLTGRHLLLTDAKTKVVYVQSDGPSGKIVQLIPWRDQLLALDNNGSILQIATGFDRDLYPAIQMWMREPRFPR
jgi:hypothetical protein